MQEIDQKQSASLPTNQTDPSTLTPLVTLTLSQLQQPVTQVEPPSPAWTQAVAQITEETVKVVEMRKNMEKVLEL